MRRREGKERKDWRRDELRAAANLSVEGHNAKTKYSSKISETEREREKG